ncbi:MAG: SUMF1/EgtB/PvdO family nonheme iron enzyme, partial [bacterium]|nr:SUMF1/EgtB/PvdO family nonheme iron enzyme [bacterium]
MNASTNANIDDIPVCAIAAGVYPIGDHTSEVSRPAHTVHLASFAIAVHCVTNQQFTAFIADGGYFDNRYWTAMGWRWQRVQQKNEPAFWRDPRFNQPDQPVVGVCWYEAMAFTRWLREQTKRAWRLPTEVEWEAAARGAARGAGNTAPLIDLSRLNSAELGMGHPWAVQHGAVSWCGAVNLLGNVWEW